MAVFHLSVGTGCMHALQGKCRVEVEGVQCAAAAAAAALGLCLLQAGETMQSDLPQLCTRHPSPVLDPVWTTNPRTTPTRMIMVASMASISLVWELLLI